MHMDITRAAPDSNAGKAMSLLVNRNASQYLTEMEVEYKLTLLDEKMNQISRQVFTVGCPKRREVDALHCEKDMGNPHHIEHKGLKYRYVSELYYRCLGHAVSAHYLIVSSSLGLRKTLCILIHNPGHAKQQFQ